MHPDTSHLPNPTLWERWRKVWHGVYYGTLLVTLGLGWIDGLSGLRLAAVLLLGLAIGLGYWFVIVCHPEWTGKPQPAVAAYFAVTFALSHVLVSLHPVFYLFAFSLTGHLFRLLPMRWALTGFGLVTLTFLLRWAEASRWSIFADVSFLLVAVATLVFGVLLALWIDNIIQHSRQRQRLIEALETTRRDLAAVEREAGKLEERQRLARELHDTLAQGFTSIVMHLEAAEAVFESDAAAAQRHLDRARQTARESLQEARRAVAALRPELLEQGSLPEALRRAAGRWAETTGLPATVAVTGTLHALPSEVEVTLLRAAQEALANARKHARARQVNLTLSYMEDAIALDVQDDGVGLEAGAPNGPGSGFGLRAMRERVAQLGGRLQIESAPGEGTTLAIELPLAGRTWPKT